MTASVFLEVIQRDLGKFIEEIRQFPDERLWSVQGDIKNSAGTLALHITGNLKHFLGAVLGGSGFVRERDEEFADRNVPKEKLLQGLDEGMTVVKKVLSELPDDKIQQPYPIEAFGQKTPTTFYVLIQIAAHLNYHMGQVNYLRRMR